MSTLVEELQLAADLARAASRKTGTLDAIVEGEHFARELEARIARVREVGECFWSPGGWAPGSTADVVARLTGPITPVEPLPAPGDGEACTSGHTFTKTRSAEAHESDVCVKCGATWDGRNRRWDAAPPKGGR